MEYVSIGPVCDSADILKIVNLRKNAYPFDYIFSSLEMITHCINDKFITFLDKSYYEYGLDKTSTKHTIYNKMLDTEQLIKHNIAFNTNYKPSEGNLFNHHNLIDNNDIYEAFKRRCKRFLDLINNNKRVCFVYVNSYTDNIDELIEFSNQFSNNKNIYTIGIFANNSTKKILYSSSNCIIYQNYELNIIFDEIKKIV